MERLAATRPTARRMFPFMNPNSQCKIFNCAPIIIQRTAIVFIMIENIFFFKLGCDSVNWEESSLEINVSFIYAMMNNTRATLKIYEKIYP